jgi:serine/threonine protein kinase
LNFRYLKLLGKGGFGEVYSAEKNGEIFAVKCQDGFKISLDPQLEIFLKRELSVKLVHDHLVRMYEFYNDKDD